jgi:hypothetical protein
MQKRKLSVEIRFPDSLIDYYSDERIRNFMTANIEYAIEQSMERFDIECKEYFSCVEVAFGEGEA